MIKLFAIAVGSNTTEHMHVKEGTFPCNFLFVCRSDIFPKISEDMPEIFEDQP